MIVISDTSCLGYFIIIDTLFLLKDNFSKIIIPQKVHNEILQRSPKYNLHKYFNSGWININTITLLTCSFGIKTVGLPGVSLLSKEKRLIPIVKRFLDELISNTTFKINNILYQNVLKQANEL